MSQFYIKKELNHWVVLSKSKRTGPRQIDDIVEIRTTAKSRAQRLLARLRKTESGL